MRLPFRDLTDVVDCEGDPAAVLMKGNLPAIRTSSQRALGQVFQPYFAEDLRRLRRRVNGSKPEQTDIGNSHAVIITVMQITLVERTADGVPLMGPGMPLA